MRRIREKVFAQWNKGLSLAKGEYIWIAESDDYCDKGFLKEVLLGLRHQSVMLSFARSVFMKDGKKNMVNREISKGFVNILECSFCYVGSHACE